MHKLFFIALLALACAAPRAAAVTADEIIQSVDDNLTFDEGTMDISMTDVKRGVTVKEMFAHIIFKKDKGTLMEFLRPARDKNKKILLIKDNMWMYVPGISKPVRLSGKDSFMGTSFSNRDLMDYDLHNDYTARITSTTADRYVLDMRATNKNVPYARIVMHVEKERLLPVRQELYSVSGNLIKTMDFSDVKDLGGKRRPSVFVIRETLTQGNETRVVTESMKEESVDESIFSPQRLGR
jgi:Outer membrane lipoprotein-sorting protein